MLHMAALQYVLYNVLGTKGWDFRLRKIWKNTNIIRTHSSTLGYFLAFLMQLHLFLISCTILVHVLIFWEGAKCTDHLVHTNLSIND